MASTRSYSTSRAGARRGLALAGLLLLAAAVRIAVAATQRNIVWPDEIFQTLEPAQHLAVGPWIRSWEWVVGMRSWLVPGVLAGPLWLGHQIDPTGVLGPRIATGLMLALSLTPVTIGFLWGDRLKGPAGGLFVGGVAAVWPDLIYMAPHPLTDVFASHLLLLALYAAFPLTSPPSTRRLAVAGALFGLTIYLRMQLGPAAAVAALIVAGRSRDRWAALLTGGGGAMALLGLFDWVTLGTPFQSIWLNFWFNIVGKVSDEFGVQAPLYYISAFDWYWGPTFLVALSIILFRYKTHSQLLLVLLAIVVTQSLIGHKEWRFAFPAIPIIVLLLGMRLLEAAPDLSSRAQRHGLPAWAGAAGAVAAGAVLCLMILANPHSASLWSTRRAMLETFEGLRSKPDICGIGFLFAPGAEADQSWVGGPGSTALAPGVSLYAAAPNNGWKSIRHYNALVIEEGDTPPSPFHLVRCEAKGTGYPLIEGSRTCLWRRPGGCDRTAADPLPVNWPSYFLDPAGHVRRDRLSPTLLGLRPKPFEPLTMAASTDR